MQKTLVRHYLKVNLPGIAIFLIFYLWGKNHPAPLTGLKGTLTTTLLLALQGIAAIILPLWYRILFINRMKNKKFTQKHDWIRFEKNFLSMASLSVYLPVLSYAVSISRIPFSMMILLALYALYFYFPSRKRIHSEKRIFKVRNNH
jgi:Ca2+/Na+ antiporter